MGFITVGITSSGFNVINFILFDIVLASLVFYLTADIAGLVNSASALQQLGNRLHAYNPPLVGVGLTCTRRNVFRSLALVRALAMLAVLATNFLIEGRSREIIRPLMREVVVPGFINGSTRQSVVRRHTLRRRGCQGQTDKEVYYGELRTDIQQCELRTHLFTLPTVYFGLRFVNRTIDHPPNCAFSSKRPYSHLHRFVCPNFGVIACSVRADTEITMQNTCVGVVLARNDTGTREAHLCEGAALFPGLNKTKRPTSVAKCRLARNANISDTTWVPLLVGQVRTLRDGIDAVYGAGTRNMTVKVSTPDQMQKVSEVHYAWFGILGAMLFVILSLILIDLVLRSKGFVRAANDEFGLGSLLAQSAMAAPGLVDEPGAVPVDTSGQSTPGYGATRPLLMVQNEGGVLRAHTSRSQVTSI